MFTAETPRAQRNFLLIQSGLRRAEVAPATQAGDGDWIKDPTFREQVPGLISAAPKAISPERADRF
jgi:hypothetical protein